MSEKDYATLVRGGEHTWTVILTDSSGWESGADSWTWNLLLAPQAERNSLKATVEAATATISTITDTDDTMTLVFSITATDSGTLAAGNYYVEVNAQEPDSTQHYYPDGHGTLEVREPEGGG